jgi:hypothetical protein|tara:strand:- start:66 stop:671 length:606 start_codon:yes stop_codon:yes gene_type:complete
MSEKRQSKRELFLELAQPNDAGFSRVVKINEFEGKYERLEFGNGGDWCRHDSALRKKYNVDVQHKNGGETGPIVSVELVGFNKNPTLRPINASISKEVKRQRCVILHTSKPEVDHKDGRLDDPRLSDINQQTLKDFQPLSKAANVAKRQHCKECKASGIRFDATNIGYPVSHYQGNPEYQGTCVGCYWYSPLEFRAKLKLQ